MAGSGSTSSSLTSTSQTLTHAPGMEPASSNHIASAMALFLDSVEPTNRHVFLQPPPSLPAGSLQLAKSTLDALAAQVSDEQQLRLREAGRKRKRDDGRDRVDVLKIRKLHLDGFETGQVWQQAKRIISSALLQSKEALLELEERNELQADGQSSDEEDEEEVSELDQSNEEEVDEEDEEEEESEEGSDEEDDDLEDMSELGDDTMAEIDGLGDEEIGEGEEGAFDGGDGESESEGSEDDELVEELVEDPNGLNDGFFSIDQFNKHSQWFEDQDARGDPNTDAGEDDDAVNWHDDPMGESRGTAEGLELESEDEEDDQAGGPELEEEDGGPTFGDMDLDAPEGASDDEFGGAVGRGSEDEDDSDGVYFYKDFFAPPARKGKKGGYRKSKRPELEKEDEADVQRAMKDVRRDLFQDLSDHSDSEDALSDVSAGDPKSRRSAHERRQAKVSEEIRNLEAELVAKRAWTLSGEAAAIQRPHNSLLEEDLEFEHVGKPVPVITEEVAESIEALIKRRILAQEFDEVLRRRPDTLGDPSAARRGLIELETTAHKQGLADELAEEHVKNANPDSYVSKSDEKLQREEKEIQNMWKDISGKLDALSSWHYKPKPVEPTLTVVSDVATIAMEDAQPTTAQGVAGGESMIAPQEIYQAGKETAEQGEVVGKSGLPIARQEMNREDKSRRRRRQKEVIRKAGGTDATRPQSKKAQAQKETIKDLQKGGVMVINRKGEITTAEGKKPVQKVIASSNSLKL